MTHTLAELVRGCRLLFGDLDFLAPGGVLQISTEQSAVDRLRIELPGRQYLGLQSLDVASPDGDPGELTDVQLSSWWRNRRERYSRQRLFDFDHPSGIVVQTDADDPPWLEVRFERPVDITSIRLRNVDDATSNRAAGLTVSCCSGGSWTVVYDQGRRLVLLEEILAGSVTATGQPSLAALVPVIAATVAGGYPKARKSFEALSLAPQLRTEFRRAITDELLAGRRLEWTGHGPQRSYRFWSDREKSRYLDFTLELLDELRRITPYVSLGFGAVLGAVRHGDVIPHDDDLDLIVGFEGDDVPTITAGLRRIEEQLRPRGYTVAGNWTAHRKVSRAGQKKVDVFVGLFEGDIVSWYRAPVGRSAAASCSPPRKVDCAAGPCRCRGSPRRISSGSTGRVGRRRTLATPTSGTAPDTPISSRRRRPALPSTADRSPRGNLREKQTGRRAGCRIPALRTIDKEAGR